MNEFWMMYFEMIFDLDLYVIERDHLVLLVRMRLLRMELVGINQWGMQKNHVNVCVVMDLRMLRA